MNKTINIIFPVLNEEKRIEEGLTKTIAYMEHHFPDRYEINIMDNGSEDQTESIAKKVCEKNNRVFYHKCSGKGVGLAFREGIESNTADIVGYMDIDLSTDLRHVSDVMNLFDDNTIDFVNGSRLAKNSQTTGRKWYRNITSWGLTKVLKMCFDLKATDSVCGFKFLDQKAAKWLVERTESENGWFYIIMLLLRAERSGMRIVELPVIWVDDWNSNLKTIGLVKYYIKEIWQLRKKKIKRSWNEKYERYER